MGKPTKTTTQVSMAAYGSMQTDLRRMSKEDRDRYSLPGTAGHDRHTDRVTTMESRRDYRAKAIKEFDIDEPIFGSFKGLTHEDIAELTIVRQAWVARRKAFLMELDRTHPAIKY